jgi:hypothetical protein
MNERTLTQSKIPPTRTVGQISSGLLQRKCACGGSSGLTGSCPECETKKLLGEPLQAKLRINEPGDPYEQEADRVAEQVMRMGDSTVTAHDSLSPPTPLVQRTAVRSNTGAGEIPAIVHDVLSAPGQALDADTRAFFEPRFGHDFRNVRVHSSSEAQQSANQVSASAYTVGNDIVFGAGRYQPTTHEGQRLIAHELTHVIQQRAGSFARQVIQRKQIPYGQITWADFKASPPDTKNPREGAGILSAFDVPSYSAATSAKSTRKKCKVGKTRSTEVEATAAPEPEHLLKPVAYMDQDRSWALERYTGDGAIYCAGRVNKSDRKVFEKCLSDEVTERARLLKHEQGHFDITKVMADNARASLKTKATSLPITETGCGEDAARDAARSKYESDVGPILRDLGKNWQKSKGLAQDDYDTKTGHGAKTAEQNAWEGKIKAGLKVYDPTILPAATPAVPAKPVTPPAQPKSPVNPSPGIQARIYAEETAGGNSALEDDSIHQPEIDEFRRREDELGNPAAAEASDAAIKYRGLGAACPATTEVDRVVDLTPAGLGAGFLTAYGAMAVMRVRPGERTWDGTRIQETVAPVSNTCPESFAPTSECIGASTFTVGDPGHSDRIGDQPGLVNRFYDFHVSRTRGISRLHDNTRNPQGLNSCETVCQQKYHCDGREIGRHTVTRTFTKGTSGGRDVTLVTVTKK